ncbi:sensor histidine kinase [Sorangium sp. So ce233]|uniref:sensor histidine kinase n=1 Tax=Sorangium sp. So ce233 TaxID=3133290 RepID=UPI003F60D2E3
MRVSLTREGAQLRLVVSDTGQGIPPDFLPFVFDRFRQADSSTTRRHGGVGLGLAIVRHLVELHGGRVAVHSGGEGQGATFEVTLPVMGPTGVGAVRGGPVEAGDSAPGESALPVSGTGLLDRDRDGEADRSRDGQVDRGRVGQADHDR